MKRILFTATLCVFAIAGCKREAEPTAPATATAPATTAMSAAAADAKPAAEVLATDVISEIDNSSAPAGVDVKAFAGTFGDGDITLELEAGGSYVLSGDALPASGDGTWTVEENGERIRLDPNSKDQDDRLFAVGSHDELQALGDDGKPPASAPAGSLKRVK